MIDTSLVGITEYLLQIFLFWPFLNNIGNIIASFLMAVSSRFFSVLILISEWLLYDQLILAI
jgi:hypothetical protein